jgi:hypothetical protein
LTGSIRASGVYKHLQIGKRPPNPNDRHRPSRRRPDSRSFPIQQGQAEFILKVGDSSGQCGSIDPKRPCGFGEAPGINDRQK